MSTTNSPGGLAGASGSAALLDEIRRRSRTLHGEGYHLPIGVPTGAACDVAWLLGHIDSVIGIERDRCLAEVEAEPELPGDMPDEIWEAIRNDRDALAETLRITVRLTKDGIRKRIQSPNSVLNDCKSPDSTIGSAGPS